MFLSIEDNTLHNRRFAWHQGCIVKSRPTTCPACGAQFIRNFEGEARARITRGSKWGDFIGGSLQPDFFVSQRVIDTLQAKRFSGFEAKPVRFTEILPHKLREAPVPNYYYLNVTGRIDLDWAQTEISGVMECSICFRGKYGSHRRLVPLERTWDGSDFILLGNFPYPGIYCTEKVIHLARQYRWTNARFLPMDIISRYAIGWGRGIDYLGKKWPPDWYPELWSEGMTMLEWLEELRQAHEMSPSHRPVLALLDFGQAALRPLQEMLLHGSEKERFNAAQALLGFKLRHLAVLPPNVKDAIKRADPNIQESLLSSA